MTHPLTPREKVARLIWERFAPSCDMDEANSMRGEYSEIADAILTALASGSGNHAELARLAEAATGGPWHSAGGYLTVRDPDGSFSSTIYHLDEMGQQGPDLPFQAVPFARLADAAFIAAANPATVLAILAEIAALRAERDALIAVDDAGESLRQAQRDRVNSAEAELDAVSDAIGTVRFMDQPDGGDVPLSEQVRRMASALTEAERKLAEAVEVIEFYAKTHTWRSSTVYMCGHSGRTRAESDGGNRARAFLSKEAERG